MSFGPSRLLCAVLCRSVLPILVVGSGPLPFFPRLSAMSCLLHCPSRCSGAKKKASVICLFASCSLLTCCAIASRFSSAPLAPARSWFMFIPSIASGRSPTALKTL